MKIKNKYFLQHSLIKTIALTLLFLSSLFVFIYIANENVMENENAFDARVMAFVAAHTTPLFSRIMLKITFFGSAKFLLPAYIVLIAYLLLIRKSACALDIIIIAVSSTAVMYLLKHLFKRHRPLIPVFETTEGYSFPSGHSFTSFIFGSILAYLIWTSSIKWVWKYALIVSIFLSSMIIGISRIILNVHFATDVIAAFCLGIMYILLAFWELKRLHPHKELNRNSTIGF